jgi:hypothetical protein
MRISRHEAVAIFARYCRVRFGRSSSADVRAKAMALKQRGDIDGHLVWDGVAEEMEKQDAPRAV